MNVTILSSALFSLLLSLDVSAAQSRGYKVIVNPSAPTTSIKRKELSKLFLKKVKKWDDGQPVLPVDGKPSVDARSDFSEHVHNRPTSAIEAYWQQQIFSGRGLPPPQMSSDQEIVAFVQATPGAIGYVSSSSAIGDCKLVTVEP